MFNKCPVCSFDYRRRQINALDVRQCLHCGLMWRESFDVPIEHYNKKHVDLTPEKIKDREANCASRFKLFSKFFKLDNLCDIGAGEGVFLKVLKDMGARDVFGLDPSDQVGDFTQKHKLIIYRGTIDDLPKFVKEKKILNASLFHVIEHLPDPERNLKTIFDSITPGGYFIVETPNSESFSLKKTNYVHELVYPEHFFYFNEKSLKDLLSNVGFEIVAFGKRDFNPWGMSIKESLFRLGLGSRGKVIDHMNPRPSNHIKSNDKVLRKYGLWPIRMILAALVQFLGRQDFIWFVVKKPLSQ